MFRNLVLLSTGAMLLCGQQPSISNANLRQVSAAKGLESTIRAATDNASGPIWIGYAVPAIPGDRNNCCWNNDVRGCGLEGQRRADVNVANPGPIRLEGPSHVAILMRYEQGSPEKLRVFSPDCPLDGGGLTFYWISDVKSGESVAMLSSWAARQPSSGPRNKGWDAAVHAIAMHSGPEAQAALMKFADASQVEATRKAAMFWLASSRGRQGYEVVGKVVREDPSDKVREHAIFALTQSKEPEALATIIRVAKEDKSPRVRGQSLFWLSQKASKQGSETINEAIDRDPDIEVKKKAVFALSQLPKEEGIQRLIQVARTNRNPAVRKQAMFWLGQSQDRRAVEFFEQILAK